MLTKIDPLFSSYRRAIKKYFFDALSCTFLRLIEGNFEILTLLTLGIVVNTNPTGERMLCSRILNQLGVQSDHLQIAMIALFAFCASIYALTRLAAGNFCHQFKYRLIADTRQKVFDHINNLELRAYQSVIPEELSYQISKEIDQVASGIVDFFHAFSEFIVLLFYMFFAFYFTDGPYGLIALFLIPVFALLSYFNRAVRTESNRVGNSNRDLYTQVLIYLKNLKELRFSALEKHYRNSIANKFDKTYKEEKKLYLYQELMHSLYDMLFAIFTAAMLLMVYLQNKDIVVSLIVIGIFLRIAPKINSIIRHFLKIRTAHFASKKLTQRLTFFKENQYSNNLNQLDTSSLHISLSDVHFRYSSKDKPILKGISMDIPFGSRIAIVGNSGEGKSTLLNLLTGTLSATEGSITINQQQLDQIDKKHYAQAIAYLTPTTPLHQATLRDNITVHDTVNSMYSLDKVIKIANLRELVDELPEGIETKIVQDGLNFSFGQRQRINIARALYQCPSILILDEATTNMDIHNERGVFNKIIERYKPMTMIVVTHKLHTLQWVDRIYVLKDGQFIEEGKFEDLVAKDDSYFNTYMRQIL